MVDILFEIYNVTLYILVPLSLLMLCIIKIADKIRKKPKSAFKKGRRGKICGLIFGRANRRGTKVYYSPLRDLEHSHCAIFGKSGTGKSTSILQNLISSIGRAVDADGNPLASSFNMDISGELSQMPVERKVVYRALDPASIPYNIFGPIDILKTQKEQIEALSNLALLLMPDTPGDTSEAARYYLNGGRAILTACLIYGYLEKMEFCEICKLLAGNSYKELFPKLQRVEMEEIAVNINSLHGNSEANISGCYDKAVKSIKLFATNDALAQNIRRPKNGEQAFTPDILEAGNNVFVVIPDNQLEYMSTLLGIITAQTLWFCSNRAHAKHGAPKKGEKPQPTIFFNLDEYPTLRVDILPALRLYRKLNIRLTFFCQSYHDLIGLWGEQYALSMLSNCAYWIVLSADTPQAQRFFCERIGYIRTKKRSVSKSSKTITQTEADEKEFAIAPEELGRLGHNLIAITPYEWKKLRKSYFFEK